MIKTKYPLFDVNFMAGYVPWDLHALNLPYHAHFDANDWGMGARLMAQNHVNATRFFLATGEKEGDLDNFLLPFYRTSSGKHNLRKWGTGMNVIEGRLENFWERDITTVICLASGIKGARFKHTVWHGDNNINNTCTDHRDFTRDRKTKNVYKDVLEMLWERWKTKPVIFNLLNEVYNYEWHDEMMTYARSIGIPGKRLAFEKWDSGHCEDLLKEFDCWMLIHGVNHIGWFNKWHRRGRALQYEYFVPFDWVGSDSDGHDPEFPGQGLKGVNWNPLFRRPAPQHMRQGLIHDKRKQGAGWIIMSAGAYYTHPHGDRPHFDEWKRVALDGLTKDECRQWDVDWKLFSYRKWLKRKPLGELKAIRKAMNKLFG